jgi:hypothetical protein
MKKPRRAGQRTTGACKPVLTGGETLTAGEAAGLVPQQPELKLRVPYEEKLSQRSWLTPANQWELISYRKHAAHGFDYRVFVIGFPKNLAPAGRWL